MSASPAAAFPAVSPRKVHAVIWFDYEYESGWGRKIEPGALSLHPTPEDAAAYTLSSLTGRYGDREAQLLGAGENWSYPSGEDLSFDIYELEISEELFTLLASNQTSTDPYSKTERVIVGEHQKGLWRRLYPLCVDDRKVVWPAPNLSPKPLTVPPTIQYMQDMPNLPGVPTPGDEPVAFPEDNNRVLMDSIGLLKRGGPV